MTLESSSDWTMCIGGYTDELVERFSMDTDGEAMAAKFDVGSKNNKLSNYNTVIFVFNKIINTNVQFCFCIIILHFVYK